MKASGSGEPPSSPPARVDAHLKVVSSVRSESRKQRGSACGWAGCFELFSSVQSAFSGLYASCSLWSEVCRLLVPSGVVFKCFLNQWCSQRCSGCFDLKLVSSVASERGHNGSTCARRTIKARGSGTHTTRNVKKVPRVAFSPKFRMLFRKDLA